MILFSLIIFNSAFSEEFKNKENYFYEEENIELMGTKKSIDNVPFLYLANPINVNPKTLEDKEYFDIPEKNVKKLHIAQHVHKKIPNGCVILKGYLYHRFNKYHKTKVLFSADSYRPCK